MTFKQLVDVLWQRKWLVVGVVAVAMIIAGVYEQVQVRTYSSIESVRTSVTVADAALGGELGGVQVDFDPSTITSPTVLDKAAALAGEPETNLSSVIAYEVVQGVKTNVINVTATALTPGLAQRRANSVVEAYANYLQNQITSTLATLKSRASAATSQAVAYQIQASAQPDSSIAASNLASALSTLGNLNNQIQTVENSGNPLTLLVAASPGSANGPSTAIVLLLALVAGLIAGIGAALIRDQFDNRLRGESEIELLTGLASLGELPFDRTIVRTREVLPANSNEHTTLGEGLRSIRTSVQVLLPRNNSVIVVTSVEPGDGKTFVSANLALTLARAGKDVILVGGDLRRPSLSTYFGAAADGSGFAELLRDSGQITPAAVKAKLTATEWSGLRLLPSGLQPDDPADLLARPTLRTVVDHLRKLAEIVIIDSPPAMALVDASLLGEQSNGVVVVASAERTDRSFLVETVESLRQNGVAPLGVVVNWSRRTLPKSYAPYYATRKRPTSGDVSHLPLLLAPSPYEIDDEGEETTTEPATRGAD